MCGGKLACDCVVVSDTSMYEPGVPALTYGLKGLAYFEIRVVGPNRDLHSGEGGQVARSGDRPQPCQFGHNDRGREGRLVPASPPAKPDERISRIRLSGQWAIFMD